MKNIAIIPARGGSKRIPKKNIRNFLGQPVISYAINAAIKSKVFDKVMVSTDNEEIANIYSKKYKTKFIGLRFFTVFGELGRPDMFFFKLLLKPSGPSLS